MFIEKEVLIFNNLFSKAPTKTFFRVGPSAILTILTGRVDRGSRVSTRFRDFTTQSVVGKRIGSTKIVYVFSRAGGRANKNHPKLASEPFTFSKFRFWTRTVFENIKA